MTNYSRAILAVLLAQAIWGVAGPLVKIALFDIPPFGLLFLRLLLVSLILFPIYEFKLRHFEPSKSAADRRDIFLAGFFGVFVNIAAYFLGQKSTTVSDAWVITSIGTPLVIIYSLLFLHESLSHIVYLGTGLAFAGTLIIIGTPILQVGSGSVVGNVLMFVSTVAGVISFLITKRLVARFNPLLLTYYFFLTSLAFSIPLFLWEYWQNPGWIASVHPASLLILLFIVLGSSIASYSLQSLGLKTLSPSLASTIGYASPIIAVGLSIVFLHEQLTPFFTLGAILVVIGLFLAETRHPNNPIHRLHRRRR